MTTALETPAPTTTSAATRRVQTPWAALVVIGAIGGVLSGLFAIGGAVVMVPLLQWRAGMDHRRAAATSLVAIIPTAVASSATYLVHGDVDLVATAAISVGAIGGAMIGSRLLRRLPLKWLQWFFITFILLIAAHLLIAVPEPVRAVPLSPLVVLGYLGLGLATGIASGVFGIGGAIITVPMLGSLFGLSAAIAKGTALLVSIPTSLAGTVGNRRGGNPVDVRAGLVLGLTAAVTAVPAVYLAVALSPEVSAVTFAVLLVAIAAQLIVKAVHTH
ncbi:sulfite exporter TauE/SafE family protein [Mycobacterium sp. NPDC006124]|uniref:sulfite exporter TauE/SafE family protein n=1 Tax=Mycobacterium sp. NPDC006124 TaxID=3156729 RepID=UPI0033B2D6B6